MAVPGVVRSPSSVSRAVEDLHQRFVECFRHRDFVVVGDDDARELRELARFRFQVERFDVEEGVVDGEHQQVAAQYAGAALVPERELLRDGGVLVGAGLDLHRAVDEAILG